MKHHRTVLSAALAFAATILLQAMPIVPTDAYAAERQQTAEDRANGQAMAIPTPHAQAICRQLQTGDPQLAPEKATEQTRAHRTRPADANELARQGRDGDALHVPRRPARPPVARQGHRRDTRRPRLARCTDRVRLAILVVPNAPRRDQTEDPPHGVARWRDAGRQPRAQRLPRRVPEDGNGLAARERAAAQQPHPLEPATTALAHPLHPSIRCREGPRGHRARP